MASSPTTGVMLRCSWCSLWFVALSGVIFMKELPEVKPDFGQLSLSPEVNCRFCSSWPPGMATWRSWLVISLSQGSLASQLLTHRSTMVAIVFMWNLLWCALLKEQVFCDSFWTCLMMWNSSVNLRFHCEPLLGLIDGIQDTNSCTWLALTSQANQRVFWDSSQWGQPLPLWMAWFTHS